MADNIYKCPKCSATLKPAQAIAPGKKIKCPKCQHIFAPTGDAQPVAAAKPAAAAKPKPTEDDDVGTYGFKEEAAPPPQSLLPTLDEPDDDDDQPKKKKGKKAAAAKNDDDDDAFNKKFPKSKKGTAQAICQKPTNQMLMTSSFACVSCIISGMMAVWPLIFMKEKTWSIEVLGLAMPRLLLLVLAVAAFVYNGAIALGAVKIQSMESASVGLIGCMLCIIPVSWLLAVPAFAWWFKLIDQILGSDNMFVWIGFGFICIWYLYVGLWNLKTLRDPDVVAAFAEPKAKYED